MHLIRRIVILGALFALALPATASAAGNFNRFGPYVGINAAWGYPLFEDEIQNVSGDSSATVDPSWGLDARLGLRLFSFLAVEGQYEWMDDFEATVFGQKASITGNTFTGNVKFYIPIWRIHPYALAGIGFTKYKIESSFAPTVKQDLFAGRLGGGADIYLTEKVALNAEVAALLTANDLEFNSNSFSSLNYLSVNLGLMYRF
jgi:opacity protein-like surface antigen